MSWIKNLGEKSSRTDVWVILYVLLTFASAFFFFACGTGFIPSCDAGFIKSNMIVLTSLITGMMVDLGIKRWKGTNEKEIKEIVDKIIKNNQNDNNP